MVSILPRALSRRVKDVNETGGSPEFGQATAYRERELEA